VESEILARTDGREKIVFDVEKGLNREAYFISSISRFFQVLTVSFQNRQKELINN